MKSIHDKNSPLRKHVEGVRIKPVFNSLKGAAFQDRFRTPKSKGGKKSKRSRSSSKSRETHERRTNDRKGKPPVRVKQQVKSKSVPLDKRQAKATQDKGKNAGQAEFNAPSQPHKVDAKDPEYETLRGLDNAAAFDNKNETPSAQNKKSKKSAENEYEDLASLDIMEIKAKGHVCASKT
ncbi:hypothetical protein GCK32_015573 [Trichostrongylus colubriformis]|uniref:Uncharacterized protein n=1 Tax=Trichostrongylus colubriformis TaxID=6319 RepID=A0AAN8FE97_TRICO